MKCRLNLSVLFLILFNLLHISVNGQTPCLQVTDGDGVYTDAPEWLACFGMDYNLDFFLLSDVDSLRVDWGDGTIDTLVNQVTTTPVPHVYAQTINIFSVTILDITNGCTITGEVIMEEPTTASIVIPDGGVTQTCAPRELAFVNASSNVSSTTTFIWNFGDGSPSETFTMANLGDTTRHTYLPRTVDCQTMVTLEAFNRCSRGVSSFSEFNPIQIWDFDDAQISASSSQLCYPDTTVRFNNVSVRNCLNRGNVFQRQERWVFHDLLGPGLDSIIDWTPWPPTFERTIEFPGRGTYTVTLMDSSFCGIDMTTQTIVIGDAPTVSLTVSSDSICEGDIARFTRASTLANYWRWDFQGNDSWSPLFGTTQNRRYNTAGTYDVRVEARILGASAACRDTATVRLTVLPTPTANFNIDETDGCDSLFVNYTDASIGATQWTWDFGNGQTDNTQTPIQQVYRSSVPQTFFPRLQVENADGCTNSITKIVRVHQTPTASFAVNSLCQNEQAQFESNSTTAAAEPIQGYQWSLGDGTSASSSIVNHTYAGAGTINVELIVNTSFCSDTVDRNLTIESAPIASFTSNLTEGCPRLFVNLTNTSIGAVAYQWDLGDNTTSTDQDPSVIYENTTAVDQTYDVTLRAETAFGCVSTTASSFRVFPGSVSDFSFSPDRECSPHEIMFTNSSIRGGNYQWIFGDGSTSSVENPNYEFNNTSLFLGQYPVMLVSTSTNGCTDTVTKTVEIYPEANFPIINDLDSGCNSLSVDFSSTFGAVDYQWDFGDGTIGRGMQIDHVFDNTTNLDRIFTVRLIATNAFNCVDTNYQDIKVFPTPVSQFFPVNTIGCSPFIPDFSNTSSLGSRFEWIFGDGDTLRTDRDTNVQHTYTNTSFNAQLMNEVKLIAISDDGCSHESTGRVNVYPLVSANYEGDTIGCSPFNFMPINTSLNGDQFRWEFGNGIRDFREQPTHLYIQPNADANYNVRLDVTSPDGCIDSIIKQVIVYQEITPVVSLSLLSGCSPLNIEITNQTTGADEFEWIFGDGDTLITNLDTAVNHTYLNTSFTSSIVYNLLLNARSSTGCEGTVTNNIRVHPIIEAQFESLDSGCAPIDLGIRNTSLNAFSYQWVFGDGGTSFNSNPLYIYRNNYGVDTSFILKLYASSLDGCADSVEKEVEIYREIGANYSLDANEGCSPFLVNFVNNSFGADEFEWIYEIGDTLITSRDTAVYHTYLNNSYSANRLFTPVLNVNSIHGCQDSYQQRVTIYPLIQANFSVTDTGCAPFAIGVFDASLNGNNYQWDFGDGTVSSNRLPSHTYENQSLNDTVFTLELIVVSTDGCRDTLANTVLVYPEVNVDFGSNVNNGCSPLEVVFTNNSFGARDYQWVYQPGDTLKTDDVTHQKILTNNSFSLGRTYSVQLSAISTTGCSGVVSKDIVVHPLVSADFEGVLNGCAPFEFSPRNTSLNNYRNTWGYGDGNQSSGIEPRKLYQNKTTNDTVFTAYLAIETIDGCVDTIRKDINVYKEVTADFSTSLNAGCSPFTIDINNFSVNADTVIWNYGDGLTSRLKDATHEYTFYNTSFSVSKRNRIRLMTKTDRNCSAIFDHNIEIYPLIKASFEADTIGCSPHSLNILNTTNNADRYSWDFGDGVQTSLETPAQVYINTSQNSITYQLIYAVESPDLCVDTLRKEIVVFPEINAEFDVSPLVQRYPDTIFTLANRSNLGPWNYQWDLDPGIYLDTNIIEYHYTSWGLHEIKLTYSNLYCTDTDTQIVHIRAPFPIPDLSGGGQGCTELEVIFENTSQFAKTVEWDFGDGTRPVINNDELVYHRYFTPGIFDVTLKVTGFDGDVVDSVLVGAVEIYESSEANFQASPRRVIIPDQPVQIFNFSYKADSYLWDFGDGYTSTEENPTHTYDKIGVYDIKLITNNSDNCPDTSIILNAVNAITGGEVSFPNAFTPDTDFESDGRYDRESVDNNVFFPFFEGVQEYHLLIYDRWGKLLFESFEIGVGWNGYYRGVPCKQDVYVWKIEAVLTNGSKMIEIGDVTLLR